MSSLTITVEAAPTSALANKVCPPWQAHLRHAASGGRAFRALQCCDAKRLLFSCRSTSATLKNCLVKLCSGAQHFSSQSFRPLSPHQSKFQRAETGIHTGAKTIERKCFQQGERGVALLLVVFIVALGTMMVFELGRTSRYDARSARAFAERVQGNFIIRSGFNLSQIILAIPKLDRPKEDWLGDLWAQVGRARELPVQGLPGAPRVEIIDESSKLNVNWLGISGPNGEAWRARFASLFNQLGFAQESFSPSEFRTIGNNAFGDLDQVAVITDWVDPDRNSFSSPNLGAKGIESGAQPGWFFNRELRTLSEMLAVPGITRERLSQLMPYVRVGDSQSDSFNVNVNTARYETLVALGYPTSTAAEIVVDREREPITSARLKELNKVDPALEKVVTTQSSGFSVVVRVRLPNSVRWGRAEILVTDADGSGPRATSLQSMELY